MNLRVELEHFRSIVIVRLFGELDHHTADQVRTQMDEAIMKREVNHVVLSLKGLEFMDSSGLGVILGRYKLLKKNGGKMAVSDANPAVYRLFEMSGLFKIMPFYETERMALTDLEVAL